MKERIINEVESLTHEEKQRALKKKKSTSKEMDSIVSQLSPIPRSSNPVISKESQR